MTLGTLELETVTIRDRVAGNTEITGYKIGEISTMLGAPSQGIQRPKPRWGVNTVWVTQSGLYVLVRQAFSRVYHTEPTTCRTVNKLPRGEKMRVSQMVEELGLLGLAKTDAISCDVCQPDWPEDLPDGEIIRYEAPRRSIDRCPEGPAQVVSRLTRSRKFSGITTSEVPEPARALIELCALNDPYWLDADTPVEKIS